MSSKELKYRIIKSDGKIKFAGTGEDSWFTKDDAFKKVDRNKGEMIYEYDYEGNRLWEVI